MESEPVENESYSSDDSSYYGSPVVKARLEARDLTFDAMEWWKTRSRGPNEMAASAKRTKAESASVVLSDRFQGKWCGRQLSETVDEFLQRLPPASSEQSGELPWIWIANPFIPYHPRDPTKEPEDEEEGPDMNSMYIEGLNRLEELEGAIFQIRQRGAGQPAAVIAREISKERDKTVMEIQKMAIRLRCTSGKWMLFSSAQHVNDTWSTVAHAIATNQLGSTAKVAPRSEGSERKERVICIYTRDFSDKEDVLRVLRKIKDLGLLDGGRPIYYKCDVYTHLNIKTGNEWDIKPSLYSSADMLKAKGKTIDMFFGKKKQ